MKTAEKTKFIKTCTICGEKKTDFCKRCQYQVAKDDGLLVNVCSDCCRCHESAENKFTNDFHASIVRMNNLIWNGD